MKKILVTGACGYLGARLSKHLAENGYSITAFDSFDPSVYSQWNSLIEEVVVGDIRDETTVSNCPVICSVKTLSFKRSRLP